MAPLELAPFRIEVPQHDLDDLATRLRSTRWPAEAPGDAWVLGTDERFMRDLAGYWLDEFDWRAAQGELNQIPQFVASLDGTRIHFVHVRSTSARARPLILTHGWPSAFIEYRPVVELLREDFDLVVPSLPGYAFSERPLQLGVNYRRVADMWHQLMSGLGYDRYAVGGGDFGAGVASLLALDHAESVIGVHLTTFELLPERDDIAHSLTLEERAFLDASDAWWQREKGYKQIQSTRPQTLSYALADSPVGTAAWILEKWRAWTDCDGDLERKFGRDYLLCLVSLYWLKRSITTSLRDYYDNGWHPSLPHPSHRIERPTAFAVFGHGFAGEPHPPRSLVERLYNVIRWTDMPRGGHFAPIEERALVAADIRDFFADLA